MRKKIMVIVILGIMILGMGGYYVYNRMHEQAILDSMKIEFVENPVIEYGEDIDLMSFVKSSEGQVSCLGKIDNKKIEQQSIVYEVEKEGKIKEFTLEVDVKDTKAPIITLVSDKITIEYEGKLELLKNIKSVTDEHFGDLEFAEEVKDNQVGYYTINGEVNTKKAGLYKIKVIAVDMNGNKSEKEMTVVVKEKVEEVKNTTSNNQSSNNQTSNDQTSNNESQPDYTADPNNKVIVINPGHQAKGNSSKEAVGPGSSTMKAKVSTGATGVSSGKAESLINLEVGLKLRDELQARGYTVVMTRTSQNVNMSNQQRAQVGNNHNAAAVIHLHCDSASSSSARGAHTIAIAKDNPYCSQLYSSSSKLAQKVISSYCSATGISSRGVSYRNDLTGLNWSEVPAIYIEMGFLSNSTEDGLLSDTSFQYKCAKGIADGIDAYFK